jgi:hypothetical protein
MAKLAKDDATDAARYRALRSALFQQNIDIGEAILSLRVIGNCPAERQFDRAVDALRKT